MLFRKTESTKRGNYVYHFANGDTSVIDAADVGEELIRFLHSSDDAIVYNNIKNSRPKVQEWQKVGIEQWKEQHPGEEVPKNWNLSLDGLSQTEDADHSSYMKELAETGLTMIIVTHEMAFARDVSSQVLFMDEGRILEQGTPQEVLENPREERTKQFLSRFTQG